MPNPSMLERAGDEYVQNREARLAALEAVLSDCCRWFDETKRIAARNQVTLDVEVIEERLRNVGRLEDRLAALEAAGERMTEQLIHAWLNRYPDGTIKNCWSECPACAALAAWRLAKGPTNDKLRRVYEAGNRPPQQWYDEDEKLFGADT